MAAIFRSPVFNASETFVSNQAAALANYQPLVVGLQWRGHVPRPLDGRVMLATRGQALALKLLDRPDALAGRIARFGPRLIHAHFATDGLLALPLARALQVPVITTLHGYDVTRSRARLMMSGRFTWMRYAAWGERLRAGGDLFLPVSDALREIAIAAGFPPARTFTHYIGVDLERFRPAMDDSEDRLTVLHVGRLVEKKGTAILLRAFAALCRDCPAAKLVIIGDGPRRPALETLAAELGITGKVHFLGARPAAEVTAWMQRSAVLAAPSVRARDGDMEGLPTVIVEAAACGKPVVVSDHSGNPEAVEDGRTGFVVAEGAIEPLAQRLREVLAAPDLRRQLGAAGREMAECKFDARRQNVRLEALYDDVIAGTARRREKLVPRSGPG